MFMVFSKDKIISYLVSIGTVALLFVISFAMTKNNEEIIKKMKHKFSIINFNERVSNYLKTRFNLDSDEQLYSIFEPKLITITFGKKGVEFIYNNNVYKYSLTCSTPEVDSTGAGDAFFSSIIKDWIKTNLNFDINKF